jgi:ribonucleoside-diphosphate reductase alpha chain
MPRERLPDRRNSEFLDYEVMNFKFTASFRRFEDGRVGELFVNTTKPNSPLDIVCRDMAIIASLCLQYGCPLDVIQHAICRDEQGRAQSPLHVLDLIASAKE